MRALAVVLAFFVLSIGDGVSHACDRDVSPLEEPEVGAVVADVVITADVIARDDRGATVQIAGTLRGARAGVEAGDTLEIGELGVLARGDGCSQNPIEAGKRYVFALWEPRPGQHTYRLIDRWGGARPHAVDVEATYARAVAAPLPHSTWSTRRGIATQLVLAPNATIPGDFDLHVVIRNVGAKPITYRDRPWPRATQSRCALSIVHASTRARVAARRVPTTEHDLAAYFAKHARPREVALPPGAAYVHTLSRITTPRGTFDHQAELGFVYYPPVTAGEYAISATCRNLFGSGTRTSTATLRATL